MATVRPDLRLVEERPAQKIARLQQEARQQSLAELEAWFALADQFQARTEELSTLDVPVGIKDRLRRFSETVRVEVLGVAVLNGRKS